MRTLQTNFRNEQDRIKDLFQELFQIQIQLTEFSDLRFYFYDEIQSLIETIDRLMQCLMDNYDS